MLAWTLMSPCRTRSLMGPAAPLSPLSVTLRSSLEEVNAVVYDAGDLLKEDAAGLRLRDIGEAHPCLPALCKLRGAAGTGKFAKGVPERLLVKIDLIKGAVVLESMVRSTPAGLKAASAGAAHGGCPEFNAAATASIMSDSNQVAACALGQGAQRAYCQI